MSRTAYTFVVTVEVDAPDRAPEAIEEMTIAIREEISEHGLALVGCDWIPDRDTIADAVDADEVVVVDMNPTRREIRREAGVVLGQYEDHVSTCAFLVRGDVCTCPPDAER